MALQSGPHIISFSSGKGGVGKTTVAVNIAVCLSREGKRVLLIDGDLGLANVDVVLGLDVRHTIRETVEDGRDLRDTLVEISPGFFVLPASSGVPEMTRLSREDQELLLKALEGVVGDFDYVLVDTAAGIGESVLWFNNWVGSRCIIFSPDPTSMTDAYALMKVLTTRYNKSNFFLIVNQVQSGKEGKAIFLNMERVLAQFLDIKPEFLGAIPRDNAVVRAIRNQKPFLQTEP
ncbi:MAG: MinD/ParA family protein, partial [Desulfobulbaceae bacterium]|nr:MinD/ParA family protein [Desulfobulbaceae bacterium]